MESERLYRAGLLTAVNEVPITKVTSNDYDRLVCANVMPGFLVWAGMDAAINQECPFHDSQSKRSFYVYQQEGRWGYKCLSEAKCGVYGNVIELYHELVRRSPYKPDWWSRKHAAGDLLLRIQAGEMPEVELVPTVCNKSSPSQSANRLLHYLRTVQREHEGLLANCGAIALPRRGIAMSVREVLRGLYTQGEGGIILKERVEHTNAVHTVEEWLAHYREWKVAEMSYTVQTYCTGASNHEFAERREYAV